MGTSWSADVADENSKKFVWPSAHRLSFNFCSLLRNEGQRQEEAGKNKQGSNMDASSEQLSRPLLSDEEEEKKFDVEDEEEAIETQSSGTLLVPASTKKGKNDDGQNDDDDGREGHAESGAEEEGDQPFTIQNEIVEMASLALPLAISFFGRMGMAR